MSKEPTSAPVDWDDLDDTESDDSGDSGSEGESNDSQEEEKEERKVDRQYDDMRKGKYGDNRGYNQGYGGGGQRDNYKGDPNSNYSQFYRSDPDFFVKVISKEEPPHEVRVKFQRRNDNAADLSKSDVSKILEGYGVVDFKLSTTNMGELCADITIDDSQEAAKIYAGLYDSLFKRVQGYKPRVFYQRDVRVLEKYGDEEAERYYKEQEEKKNQPPAQQHHREKQGHFKKDNRHDNRHDNRNRRDGDNRSYRGEDPSSAGISGFGSSEGPKLFFNKKKSDIDTTSLKDLSKSNPLDAKVTSETKEGTHPVKSKIETPLEPIKEKAAERQPESKKNEDSEKAPELKRKNTDSEFEVGNMGSNKNADKHDSHTLVNKVDPKANHHENSNDEWKREDEKVHLKGRHSQRGKARGTRSVYGAKFAHQTIEKHLNSGSESNQPGASQEESTKPMLIGDRPETEQNEEKAAHQNLRFSGIGNNQHSGRGYRNEGHGYENRSRGGYDKVRGGYDRGRGGYDKGRGGYDKGRGGYDRGRGGYDRGRGDKGYNGGYNKRGRGYNQGYQDQEYQNNGSYQRGSQGNYKDKKYTNNDAKTYYPDQRSQYSDKYDIESTHSQRSNRGGKNQFKHTYNKTDTYNNSGSYNNTYEKSEKQEKPQRKPNQKEQVSDMAQGKGKVKTSNLFDALLD